MRGLHRIVASACLILYCLAGAVLASEPTGRREAPYSVAVLPFAASGQELSDLGAEVPVLLNAYLSGQPALLLVERGEVDKAWSEVELGLSGTVDPSRAARVGHLTGAQILVTGRIFPVRDELIVIAKIIGVENGRVYGEMVTLPLAGSVAQATSELANKVAQTIARKADALIPAVAPKEDVVTRLRRHVAGKTLPSVSVRIAEQSLGRRGPIDPAVETEIGSILQQLGFTIIDPMHTNTKPDVAITGEAFSEFGMRRGHLVSSKARVEVRAVDKQSGKVLLIDRAVAVAVDLSQEIAGKAALAQSGAQIAERLVPALVTATP